jgi:single-stranded DNA-binding protein
MEVKGKLIEIYDTAQISDRFQKREFVIEYADNPQYPEYIKFETVQDRCSMLDEYQIGDEVTVHFNLKGRKWTDRQGETKYFNSLQAWRMQKGGETSASPTHEASSTNDLPFADEGGDEDDLPF